MDKRRRWYLAVPIVMMGLATQAQAVGTGDSPAKDVVIEFDHDSSNLTKASGAIHTARFGTVIGMSSKWIGCDVATYQDLPGLPAPTPKSLMTCSASTVQTTPPATSQLTCYSDDPGMIAAALSITIDSYIEFETEVKADTDPACQDPHAKCNYCNSLLVSNSSTHWQVPVVH